MVKGVMANKIVNWGIFDNECHAPYLRSCNCYMCAHYMCMADMCKMIEAKLHAVLTLYSKCMAT